MYMGIEGMVTTLNTRNLSQITARWLAKLWGAGGSILGQLNRDGDHTYPERYLSA
jgi:hypothetical protein